MSMSLPRKTLTLGVMGGFMVCTAMVSAQTADRPPQTGDTSFLSLDVYEAGPRQAVLRDAAGCPASSCLSVPGQCTLTQSLDLVTIEPAVRCSAPLFPDGGRASTQNGWARCFNLATEGLPTNSFTVSSVTFGVFSARVTPPEVDIQVDVVLYSDSDGCPPPSAFGAGPADPTITEIARETIFVTPADEGTFITVPIVGFHKFNAGDLIVEIEQVNDGTVDPLANFQIAVNAGGQCGASYLRAADCGIPGWIDVAAIGFPDNQFVIVVEGEIGEPPCPATRCSVSSCAVTQSNEPDIIETQVACSCGIGTTPNGWARCYDLATEGLTTNPLGYSIQSVTFGVLQAGIDGIEVDIVVHSVDGIGCPVDFVTPGDPGVIEIARESLLVNIADIGTFITVPLSGKPKVSDDANIVVDIVQISDGCPDDGPFFNFRANGNTGGECDKSYLRAARCGIPFWLGYEFIGFEFIHTTQVVEMSRNPFCFGVEELEIEIGGDDDSPSMDDDESMDPDSESDSDSVEMLEVEVEGSFDAGPNFDPVLEDITFHFIDVVDGDTHTYFIPAGSFQPDDDDSESDDDSDSDSNTFKFRSDTIKAEFNLNECEFEFEAKDDSLSDMDGPDITVQLDTSASGFGQQTVTTEVDDDELEFEADDEPDCCDDDDSGAVTGNLNDLISNWGACRDCGNCPLDVDGDCSVGVADLLILLANWR